MVKCETGIVPHLCAKVNMLAFFLAFAYTIQAQFINPSAAARRGLMCEHRVKACIIMARATQIKQEEAGSLLEQLLSSTQSVALPKVGDTVTAKVLSVSKNEIHLDIGGIASGVVRGREAEDPSGAYENIKIGDDVQAIVVDLENELGEIELSFRQASHQKSWDALYDLMRKAEIVEADVLDANRGGLMIKVGKVGGFLPVSQLAPEFYPRVEGGDKNRILEILSSYIGMQMPVKIIDVGADEERLIVSGKDAWAEQEKDKLALFKVGDTVEGTVTGVVDFGAFMEFGEGLEGLIHISEIAWQRIDNPRDYLKRGQKVKAQIIQVDGTKISLSLKRLLEDPWVKAVEKYKVGDKVKGKILKVNPFGVFVELDKDIHGLAHVSELSTKKVTEPTDIVKEGETHEFQVISVEPSDHRLGLSIKALERADQVKKFKEDKEEKGEKSEKSEKGKSKSKKEKKDEDKEEQTSSEPAEKKKE